MASKTLQESSVARLWAEWSTVTDIEANTSTTTLQLKLTTLNGYNIGPWGDFNGSYFGSTNDTFDGAIPNFEGTRTLKTVTKTVAHNNEGIGSLTIQWKWGVNSPWGGFTNPSGSFAVTLPEIPRATPAVLSDNDVELGDSITITLNRAINTYTHDVAIYYNDKSLSIRKGVATTVTWTVPDSIARWMPKASNLTAQIRVTTYNSSGGTVGIKNTSITIRVPDRLGPTITSVTITEASQTLSDIGLFVKDYSSLKVDTVASSTYDATISSVQSTIEETAYTGASFTTGILRTAGQLAVKVTVMDSRGKTASLTKNITVEDYSPPQILAFDARRADAGGNIKENGEHAKISYKYEITPLDNKNAKTIKLKYKLSAEENYSDLATLSEYSADSYYLTGAIFDTSESYDIQIEIEDSFTRTSLQVKIETERAVLEIYRTGRGVAIGKAAELDETFDVDLNALFRQPAQFQQSPTFDNPLPLTNGFTYKPMTINEGDLNTYTLTSGVWYVGSAENRPIDASGFLIVIVNGDNSIYQKFIALNGRNYERLKTASGWTPWCGWYYYTVQGTQMWERVYIGLDGSYEAYGKRTMTVTYNTQTNGVYQMAYNIGLGLMLPDSIQIDGDPMCFFQAQAANEFIFCRYIGFTSSQTGSNVNVRLAKITQGSSISTDLQVHVIGRWKK